MVILLLRVILGELNFKYKYEQKIDSIISGYKQEHDSAMWIPDIYGLIITYLCNKDRHNLWLTHGKNIIIHRPDPYKCYPQYNRKYIYWSLYRLPIYLNYYSRVEKYWFVYTTKLNEYFIKYYNKKKEVEKEVEKGNYIIPLKLLLIKKKIYIIKFIF